MEHTYCIPGLVYKCPYALRCEAEGKSSIVLVTIPITPLNSKIKKHFVWNQEGFQRTCLLRRITHKDFPDLIEGLERSVEEEV